MSTVCISPSNPSAVGVKGTVARPALGAWAKPLRVDEATLTTRSDEGEPQEIPRSISTTSTAASPMTSSTSSLQSLGRGGEEKDRPDMEQNAVEKDQQQPKERLRPWLQASRAASNADSVPAPRSSESGSSRARPWRKPAEKKAEAASPVLLSAAAPEFVPLLSAAAPEFVPRWRRALEESTLGQSHVPQNQAACSQMIDLDQYSDWSSDAGDVHEASCADSVGTTANEEHGADSQSQAEEHVTIQNVHDEKPGDIADVSVLVGAVSQYQCEQESADPKQKVEQLETPTNAQTLLGDFFKPKKAKKSKGRKTEDDKLSEMQEGSVVKPAPEPTLVDRCTDEPASEPDPEVPVVVCDLPSSDSQLRVKDVEGTQRDETPAPARAFDAQLLLRWRHAAKGSSDPAVQYGLVDASTSSQPVEESKAGIRESNTLADTSPSGSPPCWRERLSNNAAKVVEVSENSWAARQRARRAAMKAGGEDTVDVLRAAKSILNKLTLEKFPQLYAQLVSCGIQKAEDLQILIVEIFEKATTQHHFIDMYADLCAQLNEHFTQNPVGDGSGKTTGFKKLLLNACQTSFEKNLVAPTGLDELDAEEQLIANFQYKNRMLGNIRFIGALLVRKMLASKVLIAIVEELLHEPTSETLESLAALLTVVGPAFDTPEWTCHVALRAVFDQVATMVKKGSATPRVRCLLKDLLDLRKEGWQDRKPKKIEGPSLISEVAERAQAQDSGKPIVSTNGWEQVGRRSK